MPDFKLLHDSLSDLWVFLAPRRQTRPNIAKDTEPAICPFCVGQEGQEEELYRIDSVIPGLTRNPEIDFRLRGNDNGDWSVRVLRNKYPFAPGHEVIIHSPDHHKNLDELPIENVVLVLEAYKARFLAHKNEGKVYIFHNHGIDGGESLPHPHTQLVVIPEEVHTYIPSLEPAPSVSQTTDHFVIFCPQVSQWPDEVWIAPKRNAEGFGNITEEELSDFALSLQRVLQLLDMRHGHEFPFNFYISPENNWYCRIIPRVKRLGGFEVGTGVFVNTQDPSETIAFIKEHFINPDVAKIQAENRAEYATGV